MDIKEVCILGERVSGTCFIQKLITENTKLKINTEYGHKHFYQDLNKISRQKTSHVLFIFISRDIIEWLQSFLVNTFHADLPIRKCTDFSKFIRMEWKSIYDHTFGVPQTSKLYGSEMMMERDPLTGERFESVIQMRSSKNRHFMSIKDIVENFEHVQYEDVRDGPQEFISALSKKYGIKIRSEFINVTTIRGKGSVPYVRKDYPEVNAEDSQYIVENCDQEMEKLLGYL